MKSQPGAGAVGVAAGLTPVIRDRGARTSDRVFDALVSAIRDLRLPPGSNLSETDLAATFEVSRTPVREAIARLVDAGLVSVQPQVGTRVERIAMTDVTEAQFVREHLEVAAFEAACARPERDLSTLHQLLDRQDAAITSGDLDDFFAADEDLHTEIFNLAGFPGAWEAVQRMKLQLDRIRRLSLPQPSMAQVLIEEHRQIVRALQHGDLVAGRKHLTKHARRVLEQAPALRMQNPDYFR